ncbi:hypothetical protein MAPG_08539 [Magnaporthiopsis poae ATCC 64411]|uniref:Uncharacterized protein n=1 Tax=Magnaporthiopsis poae (strain ATCC 64411 / 73-15) TaxID=644358 RepID=A0A0C4E7M4_MAGP6|nr:hypothetical protein MAPG_08539 [Magnaporthiopsis poae ATCC 64411]
MSPRALPKLVRHSLAHLASEEAPERAFLFVMHMVIAVTDGLQSQSQSQLQSQLQSQSQSQSQTTANERPYGEESSASVVFM